MIGGRKGPPGTKMTRDEAVPAVRTKTSNKVPTNAILFIFFTSSAVFIQKVKLPGHRPGPFDKAHGPERAEGLPGKVISFHIVPLDPACEARLAGHVPVKTLYFSLYAICLFDVLIKLFIHGSFRNS